MAQQQPLKGYALWLHHAFLGVTCAREEIDRLSQAYQQAEQIGFGKHAHWSLLGIDNW
jgi:hypothetical protein